MYMGSVKQKIPFPKNALVQVPEAESDKLPTSVCAVKVTTTVLSLVNSKVIGSLAALLGNVM
jgi:hypothetical protein